MSFGPKRKLRSPFGMKDIPNENTPKFRTNHSVYEDKVNTDTRLSEYLFIVGGTLNGHDMIVAKVGEDNGPIVCGDLAKAKASLVNFYQILDMSRESEEFNERLKLLAALHPVILRIKKHNIIDLLKNNCFREPTLNTPFFTSEYQLICEPHGYMRMQKGFNKSYLYEDVLKTIELAPSEAPDGSLLFSKFNIIKGGKGTEMDVDIVAIEDEQEKLKALREWHIQLIQHSDNISYDEAVEIYEKEFEK